MDKITKFLLRLSNKERNIFLEILRNISLLSLEGLDVKKLQGEKNLYRVRKGKIRIVFKKGISKGSIIDINYRNKIYKDY